MARHVISPTAEFQPGSSRILDIGGRSIGVYNVDGRLYAMRNVCPHHGAPLCLGEIDGRMLPSEPHQYVYGEENTVIRCPWHGYEFRLEDGKSIVDPDALRVKVYEIVEEDGDVVLYV